MLSTFGSIRLQPLAAIVGVETFTRTAADGTTYGSADIGGAATLNGTSQIAIASGQMVMTATTTSLSRTATYTPVAADIDIVQEWQMNAIPAANHTIALVGRSIATAEQLRGKVVIASNGDIRVQGFYIIPLAPAGTGNVATGSALETSIAASVLVSRLGTVQLNAKYLFRMQLQGTTMRLKVWASTEAEPSAWDWTGTQNQINAAGTFGWRIVAPTSDATPIPVVKLDNIWTRQLPGRVLLMSAYPAAVADVIAGVTTLQTALTNAVSGATLITDGIFEEDNLVMDPNMVLTLKSLTPGSTTLRSWNTPGARTWTLDTANTYWTTLAYRPYGVYVDGRALYDFNYNTALTNNLDVGGTLNDLKTATWPAGVATGSAPPEGFWYDSATNRLYVRIRNEADTGYTDPSTINSTIAITRNGINSSNNGHGIKLANNNTLTIEGFRIDGFPSSGVLLLSGSTLTLTNDLFHNVYRGFTLTNPATTPVVHVSKCSFSGRGNGNSKYNGPYMMRLNLGDGAFRGIYESNLGFRASLIHTRNMNFTEGDVHDLFDGIEMKGISATVHTTQSEISYTFIHNIVDNPTEIEPDVRYVLLRIHHCFFLDGVTNNATAPFQAGVCEFDHNIVYQSVENGITGSNKTAFLKTLAHGSVVPLTSTQVGLKTHHNTVLLGVGTQDSILYVVGTYGDDAAEEFSYDESSPGANDCIFEDNIVRIKSSRQWSLADRNGTGHTGYVLSQHNTIYGDSITANHYKHQSAGGTAPPNAATHGDSRPTAGVNTTAPTFQAGANVLFYLSVNRLGSDGATSMGAINFGDTWGMPATGVTFADAFKAPMPASVGAHWGGQ